MPFNLLRYQHILWDWNGTLVNDVALTIDVMNGMLARRDMPLLTDESYRHIFSFPIRNYYEQLGFDFTVESWEDIGLEFLEEYGFRWRSCSLYDDVKAVLERVARANIEQSLLSAAHKGILGAYVAHYGLSDYFTQVIGVENWDASGKQVIGKRWIDSQDLDPVEVLLVGDTVYDSEVAHEMGVDCILIDHGHQHREKLEHCGPQIFSSLTELC